MTNNAKSNRNDRNRQAIAGVQKHITAPIVLDGVSRQPTEVTGILQDAITKVDASTAAEATYHEAVAAEKTATATADALYIALKREVLNLYKGQPTVLGDFGITEPVRKVPSAATKAAAAAKRRADAAAKKAAKAAAAAPAPATPATPPKS